MTEEILSKVYALKEALNNNEAIINLKNANEELENSDEAKILSYKMDQASTYYSDILKIYSIDSTEAKKAQKNLYLAKKALDELEVVRRYNSAYKAAKMLYNEVNKIVFLELNPSGCKGLL